MTFLLLFGLPLLAGCQLALPGRSGGVAADASGVNPITTGTVQTTSLDAPNAAPAAQNTIAAAPVAPTAPPAATPAAAPAADAAAPQTTQAPPEVPSIPISPQALACKASGGIWGKVGDTIAYSCFRQTRDAGTSCRRKTDCETECLARSRTCAPITPMIGCNPVLQADGREVTLCID